MRRAGNPKSPKSLFSGVRPDSAAQLSVAHSQQIVGTQYLQWQQAPIQPSLLKQRVLSWLEGKSSEAFLYQDDAVFFCLPA